MMHGSSSGAADRWTCGLQVQLLKASISKLENKIHDAYFLPICLLLSICNGLYVVPGVSKSE